MDQISKIGIPITVKVSSELLEKLDNAARKDGRTRASYIRKLIKFDVENTPAEA